MLAAPQRGMLDERSTWDDVRRLADELELQIHLAGMEARDRWRAIEPRLEQLEKDVMHVSARAEDVVVHELHEVRDALRALRDDVVNRAHDSFDRGW